MGKIMIKLKIYIDTSVFGGIFDIEDPVRVDVTKQVLNILRIREKYIPYISNIVIEETEKAPPKIKQKLKKIVEDTKCEIFYESDECIELVDEFMKQKVIPKKSRDDARHVAVATVNNVDIILTWNCRHLANIENKRMINSISIMLGYKQIDIVTPLEVVGYG